MHSSRVTNEKSSEEFEKTDLAADVVLLKDNLSLSRVICLRPWLPYFVSEACPLLALPLWWRFHAFLS